MRLKIIILLALITNLSFAQYGMIDRGSGENLVLSTGRSNLAWIEMNKPERIKEYLSSQTEVDYAKLVESCRMSSEKFPFDNSLPVFFDKDDGTNFYERTYFTKENGEIKYLLQIRIILLIENEVPKVLNIEFREGDKIEKLEEEFAYMKRVGDKLLVPPPPPPPPGLPVKH